MSVFELWLLFVALPGIKFSMTALAFLLIVASGFLWMINGIVNAEDPAESAHTIATKARWLIRTTVVVSVLAVPCMAFIPSEKQIALIIGGSYATQIESADELPPNLVKALNKALESYIEDE